MATDIVDATYVLDHLEKVPLLDVRPDQLFEAGRIPTAVNVDLLAIEAAGGDWQERFHEAVSALGMGPDDDIIVMCLIGEQAERACHILEAHGYDHLHFYKASFLDWLKDRSRPVIED